MKRSEAIAELAGQSMVSARRADANHRGETVMEFTRAARTLEGQSLLAELLEEILDAIKEAKG